MPGAAQHSWAFQALFSKWAQSDSVTALAHASQLPSQWRRAALQGIATEWAQRDPAGASAWAKTISPREDAQSLNRTIAERWAQKDPQAAVEFLFSADRETFSQNGAYSLFNTWSDLDPDGLKTWLDQANDLPSRARDEATLHLVRKLAEKRPMDAWKLATDLAPQGRGNCIGPIVSAWAKNDVTATLAWGRSLTDDADQSRFYDYLASACELLPRQQIGDVLRQMPGGTPEEASARVRLLIKVDPPACREYWQTLPADTRRRSLENMVRSSGSEAPEVAAELLSIELTQPDPQPSERQRGTPSNDWSRVASEFAVKWGMKDPGAVSAWIATLPEILTTAEAAYNYVANCGRFTPGSAIAWAESLPLDSKARAGAERGLARLDLLNDRPESAFERAVKITDENFRLAAIGATLSAWKRSNSEAAAAALSRSGLTAQQQQRVQSGEFSGGSMWNE